MTQSGHASNHDGTEIRLSRASSGDGEDASDRRSQRLGTLPLAELGISLAGLVVSLYLTYEHLTAGTTLACPDTGTINCVKVTTSEYATFLGVPVAVLGLAFFATMTVLSLPAAWRTPDPWLHRLRLGTVTVGVVFVCYLLWVELFRINAICLWCTVVHALTLILFAMTALHTALHPALHPALHTAQHPALPSPHDSALDA